MTRRGGRARRCRVRRVRIAAPAGGPPLPVLGLPTILSSFRRARLPVFLPVAMAAAVAGMLRGGLLPQTGKERPMSSRRVLADALFSSPSSAAGPLPKFLIPDSSR